MLNTAQQFLETARGCLWPGLAIFFLALSFNSPGRPEGFLDPKDY